VAALWLFRSSGLNHNHTIRQFTAICNNYLNESSLVNLASLAIDMDVLSVEYDATSRSLRVTKTKLNDCRPPSDSCFNTHTLFPVSTRTGLIISACLVDTAGIQIYPCNFTLLFASNRTPDRHASLRQLVTLRRFRSEPP
jgi:hypothetical protein